MEIRYQLLLMLSLLTLLLISCNSSGQQPEAKAATKEIPTEFQNLSLIQFKEKMKEENVVILDVRTPKETTQGKIEDAIVLNVKDANFNSEILKLDNSKTYLVYCRSGRRSVTACNIMAESGFENLYNLLGGYNGWSN